MLNGSLEAFALPDVIKLVAARDITGRVAITRAGVSGEISIDRGKVVAARLADDGPPSNHDEALDVVVVLFDATGGEFALHPEEWVGGPLDLDPEALLAAADERRDAWAEIISTLGTLEEPMILAPHLPDGTSEITIRADQWKLITLVDGLRSVQDVARDAALSVFATSVALAELAKAGMVTRGSQKPWEEPAVVVDPPAEVEESPAEPVPVPATVGANGDQPIALEPIRERKSRFRR